MTQFAIHSSVMVHVFFGVLGILLALALLVYVINVSEKNVPRIRSLSLYTAVSLVISYIMGGWWYVVYYAHERDIIKAGDWKWAHNFFMEWKEHVFFALLFLGILLPIVAYRNDIMAPENRRLMIILASLVVILGLAMDGSGGIISRGVVVGLLGRG